MFTFPSPQRGEGPGGERQLTHYIQCNVTRENPIQSSYHDLLLACYVDRNENFVLVCGIVVVLALVVMLGFSISRTRMRTTSTIFRDIKGRRLGRSGSCIASNWFGTG
jgi:hypothetical protein